jgi:GntR family transcriptional regulator, transcriptional repressor for pyruvate dehydrogenase complex
LAGTFEKVNLLSVRLAAPDEAANGSSAFSPQPVRRPVDQVRVSLVEAIATGRLRPGDRLPSEHEQARGFQVSRATVREALRSLTELGLITTIQGRGGGSFVNRLDSAPVERNLSEAMGLLLHVDAINVAELLEARRALEGTCARLAAARRDRRHLTAITEILDRARDDALSTDAWLDLDIRFHRAVARSAENRVLFIPLAALHAIVQPRLNDTIMPLLDRSEINAEHRAIYEAIRGRDVKGAAGAVDAHLDHLERLYREAGVL